MTVLAATTAILASEPDEPHGQVYIVDLAGRRGARVLRWARPGADRRDQAGDRGLRGIACQGDEVYVAAHDELCAFTPAFELTGTFRSAYLGDCQQIAVFRRTLYVVSAACDAILGFDLDQRRFDWGLHLVDDPAGWRAAPFQPGSALGPGPRNLLMLNSLYCDERGLFVAGARTHGLLHFDGKRIKRLVTLPEGVRDVRPWRDGVLFNDTQAACARWLTPERNHAFRAPPVNPAVMDHAEILQSGPLRAGSPGGLCVLGEARFASATVPATVALHDVEAMQTGLSITLDDDARQVIHSLARWPFAEQG